MIKSSHNFAFAILAIALLLGVVAYGEELTKGIAAYQSGDYVAALRIIKPHADHGNPLAQLTLGAMYYNGQGVAQDYEEASRQLHKAAENGNASAQFNLGVMYAKGLGVDQSYKEAVTWYRRAAEQGNAEAQINLGYMYARGKGLTQDYVQAYMWFSLPNRFKDRARKNRDKAASKMTPAEIARAQRLAQEWKPKGK